MTTKPVHYPGVDLMKYVMALMVIAIHNSALLKTLEYPEAFAWLIRLAVPFFFIISGFFLASKLEREDSVSEQSRILRSRSLFLFKKFGVWLLIYFPWTVYYFTVKNPDTILHDVFGYCRMVLFTGESPYSWPLWFIYSMAIVCLLCSFDVRCRKLRVIFIGLYLVAYLCQFYVDSGFDTAGGVYVRRVSSYFSRPLLGGLYMLVGFWLYRITQNRKIPALWFLPLLAVSFIFYHWGIPFWEMAGGAALAILGLSLTLKTWKVWNDMRVQSMWIYFLHMYVLMLLYVCCPELVAGYKLLFLSLVYVVSMAVAWLLDRLQQRVPLFRNINFLIK